MSSSPTPPPNRKRIVTAALMLLALGGWAVSAVQAVRTGQPIPPPPITVVADATPQAVQADLAPIDYEGARFSGCDHDHAGPQRLETQAARWPTDRITYSVDYASAKGLNPPLSDAAIQGALKQAAGWWGEQLAIEFVEVQGGAQIPIRFERIDGAAGILAEAYLADGTNNPKPLRFDNSERWTPGAPAANLVSLPTVACHELGHSLGLGHDAQNAPAVMRPTYTASLPREQERDIGRMVQLGYKRRAAVPPAATDVLSFPTQAKTEDVVGALEKAGFKVTKP
ncbi:MAG TPA: matrixin family metalloprotease [Gemmata sp.]